MSQPAPFIPSRPDESPVPPAPWRVFGTRSYFRLWLAQVTSSTGDWVGLIAILAIAARVSHNSGAAVGLVMAARVIPGFLLGTVGGVIIDRFDRRRVMVTCDVGRAVLLAVLPFMESLAGLVAVSFALEIMTLLWGPAKDASVPHLVKTEQLPSANTLSLVASFATFPLASVCFSLLAALAAWLGSFDFLKSIELDQEALALLVDALTFVVSALIVVRLPIPHDRQRRGRRVDWTGTLRDIKDGLHFIRNHPRVRGIIIGLGLALIGGGAMIPLGPVFARKALGGDSATFGALMAALGFGAAAGVVALLALQRRLPKVTVFEFSIIGSGVFLFLGATATELAFAVLAIALVGACAGTAYVTGFTVLQETVHDEVRGRTFATMYTVVRLCLLISLVISPLWADFWDWVTGAVLEHRTATFSGVHYSFPGVRVALWCGGLINIAAGFWAWWSMRRAERAEARRAEADGDPGDTGVADAGAA
ncbi:MAG: MFS transporter [Actinobacteria bacterium]|nr:MAG: MFS transporter [Actinomycetota bacterium]